jgi:hypothetical protein
MRDNFYPRTENQIPNLLSTQPVASLFTDRAIPAHLLRVILIFFLTLLYFLFAPTFLSRFFGSADYIYFHSISPVFIPFFLNFSLSISFVVRFSVILNQSIDLLTHQSANQTIINLSYLISPFLHFLIGLFSFQSFNHKSFFSLNWKARRLRHRYRFDLQFI